LFGIKADGVAFGYGIFQLEQVCVARGCL
jgi:hypothetical protein